MQKKIIFLLIVSMLFSFSGCGKKVESDDGDALPQKVTSKSKKNESKAKTGWTSDLEVIYKPTDYYDAAEFSETCKVNGKKYKVDITLEDKTEYSEYNGVTFSINNASYKLSDTYFFGLSYVAMAELYGEDIALFAGFSSEGDWNDLAVLRYDGTDLKPLVAGVNYNGLDDLLLSFTPAIDIELADYSDFKMWVWTPSRAMWKIKKTYTIRDDRIITHQEDRYEVNIKDFLSPHSSYEDYSKWYGTSKEEYDKLSEGYVMCHDEYAGMEKGTYFTVLYDDGRDNIYIKVDSGEEFWTEIPEYPDGEQRIAPNLFYLAG